MSKFYDMKQLDEIKDGVHVIVTEKTRWCYGCGEIKPLDHEHWGWGNKAHTRFKTKCRKCTNYDSMISHRIHKKVK